MKFPSPKVALCLYKSNRCNCVESCCYTWAGALNCYFKRLDKLQKRVCKTVGPSLLVSLEPSVHRRNVVSLGFSISITLVDVYLNWLNWFHILILEEGQLVILIDCMILLSPFQDVMWVSMSTDSFLAQLGSGILCP